MYYLNICVDVTHNSENGKKIQVFRFQEVYWRNNKIETLTTRRWQAGSLGKQMTDDGKLFHSFGAAAPMH